MLGNYTKVSLIQTLRPGDHVCVWDESRWPIRYQHHGIVWTQGDSEETIQVCHVWSPLNGYQEAQADSCVRVSTLREFLSKRKISSLRVVEYNTSNLRELLSKWGEVHYSKADLPEVVLARCKFLMGLGKGEFNIFSQNCEHYAHWCMTGEQWCKQVMTKPKTRVPFEHQIAPEQVLAMEEEIEAIKGVSRGVVDKVLALDGQKVRLRVNGYRNRYVVVLPTGQVSVADIADVAPTATPAVFELHATAKVYNCVKISLRAPGTNTYMFSRSTLSCFRDIRMKNFNCCRGRPGLTWELSSNGYMKSMNQHRRYIGIRSEDHRLVDVSMRGDAARVELVPVDATQEEPPEYDAAIRKLPSSLSLDVWLSSRDLDAQDDARLAKLDEQLETDLATPYAHVNSM
ncbi:hypothetical protein H310_11962 [Aphanomyces invadans]|uniref:LRAT domain-containing protein n=1 Tax=Aphanomyces invadans TaxID=157072 RepID=A0A024TJU2_9STRA|nr:hypothetical protein H310_11962 [Aphanomyces invadans]ETV94313.1 hypothetical protein H310_11962 [Aphanomyces invadans]RHY32184.1 hypothetical protein DYB32_002792 [Aphanomyces invadans]|eukprot:XP_008877075.1 hypothetical protein H310_11962 [Aphanomyces invadans]